MKKSEIVSNIEKKTGLEKEEVISVVDAFIQEIKENLEKGKNVYFRGFGSFIIKERKEKIARNIKKNTTLIVPAHNIPAFKPSEKFKKKIKENVKLNNL